MNHELTKKQRVTFLIAVMLTNVAVMGDNVIFPISNNLYNTFPESVNMANYILSGPPLLLLIASLLSPLLLTVTSKRSLLVTGAALFTFGSVFGVLFIHPVWMAFTRTIVGIGQGFINVCAVALIADVYIEENIRSRFIGYFNASMNVIGFAFSYFSGIIAAASEWTNVFKLYYISVPMLIMTVIFIPKLSTEHTSHTASSTENVSESKKEKLGFEFWRIIVLFFVAATLCMIVAYFLSVYVAENNLGNETLAATATSFGQIASFFGAMLYGTFYTKLKNKLSLLGYAFLLISFISWWLFPSKAIVYVVAIGESLGYIFLFSFAYAYAPMTVPASKINLAISIVTATYGIASFIATYFVTSLMSLLHTTLITDLTGIFAVISVVIFMIDLLFALRKPTNKLKEDN